MLAVVNGVEFENFVFCFAWLRCAMLQHVRAVLAGLSGNRKKKTFLTALVGACLGAPGRA